MDHFQCCSGAELIACACRYAELNGDTRSFTPEEEDLFDRSAEFAYASFRDKAAESRRMPKEELQKHAQGRVWSGKRALDIGLIDGLGGVDRAISIAKQEAGIGESLESCWSSAAVKPACLLLSKLHAASWEHTSAQSVCSLNQL